MIAGYDANPIDGIRGAKTDAALAQFIADNKLENTAAGRADFFDLLMAAAQKPNGAGFAWCNETRNVVMAALGVEDQGTVVTRGWYRVAPGKCLRPDLTGKPRGSTASARRSAPTACRSRPATPRRVAWGGSTILCTRNVKFELERSQGLRRQRPDRHRLRHRRDDRQQRNHGAVQVELSHPCVPRKDGAFVTA